MPGQTVSQESPAGATFSRRRFLQTSASTLGTIGLAASPWFQRAVATREMATPVASVGATGWDELANRLEGWLLRPGDAMYPAATVISAARYAAQPAGIAACVSPQDIATCVHWARENGVPVAIRSGGHNYAGFSTTEGLVIDVRGMLSVTVDQNAGTATVAGGANNADVGAALTPHSVYFPGGRCPTVGVSGLTLGGG